MVLGKFSNPLPLEMDNGNKTHQFIWENVMALPKALRSEKESDAASIATSIPIMAPKKIAMYT